MRERKSRISIHTKFYFSRLFALASKDSLSTSLLSFLELGRTVSDHHGPQQCTFTDKHQAKDPTMADGITSGSLLRAKRPLSSVAAG